MPTVFAVGADHLVFDDALRAGHAYDLRAGKWLRVWSPTEGEPWALTPGRGGLYAFDDDHAPAYFSDDPGATWERLPH